MYTRKKILILVLLLPPNEYIKLWLKVKNDKKKIQKFYDL